jgi:hypothetical protein
MANCFAWVDDILEERGDPPAIEAWKVVGGKLLWWPNGSLLWRWCRGMVELLLRLLLLELPWLLLWVIDPILLLL